MCIVDSDSAYGHQPCSFLINSNFIVMDPALFRTFFIDIILKTRDGLLGEWSLHIK